MNVVRVITRGKVEFDRTKWDRDPSLPHSNFITAIVFTAAHMNVSYVPDLAVFLTVLFLLALGWGFLMQKTDSLIASTLFHAGADTIIFVGIVTNLGGNI